MEHHISTTMEFLNKIKRKTCMRDSFILYIYTNITLYTVYNIS